MPSAEHETPIALANVNPGAVLAGLPVPARLRWEAYMTSVADKYHSEVFREIAERNFAEGEAKGEAQAVLTVLEARGIPVPAEVREEILACTDLGRLDMWLRRAATA